MAKEKSEFTFHEVSDKEKEEIKKQAKSIMDSFSSQLDSLDLDKIPEPIIEREETERKEGEACSCGIDREIMFDNAPKKNKEKGVIIAEKGSWTNG